MIVEVEISHEYIRKQELLKGGSTAQLKYNGPQSKEVRAIK